MSVIIKLLSKFDDSGLRKAKSGFGGLGKALGAVGIGFGISQIASELSNAVKNAQEDVISQKQLARQLKITANATDTQIAAQEDYITKLSMTTGVVDDKLRPAYGILLRATGSVSKAQELLGVSLDTSAGAQIGLEKVTKSVARAYGGNLTGLQKLVPGIKKGTDAMKFLKEQFQDARTTLANPFDQLQIAIDETKEKMGMVLLPTVQKVATYIIEEIVPAVDKFFEDVANPKTDISKAFKLFGETVATAGQNLGAFFAMMDPKNEGNSMAGFASALTWISITLGTITDGFLVLASAAQKVFSGDFNGALALMNAETSIGAMAIRNNMGVKETIDQINAKTMKTGSGLIVTGTTGDVGSRKENVIFGSPNAKLPKVPNVFKAGVTTNNVTINVTNADPKATVNVLNKYFKQNGSLPLPGVKKP